MKKDKNKRKRTKTRIVEASSNITRVTKRVINTCNINTLFSDDDIIL